MNTTDLTRSHSSLSKLSNTSGARGALAPLLLGAVLGISACAASVDDAAPAAVSATVEVLLEPLCGVVGNAELASEAVEIEDGLMEHEAWSAEPTFQAELPRLDEVLRPFADRALEPVLDHLRQQVVVPVDAASMVAGEVQRALEAAQLALPLRVQTSCHPVAEVRAAERILLDHSWHPRADVVTFGAYPDSERAQWVVTFDARDPSQAGLAADDDSADDDGQDAKRTEEDALAMRVEEPSLVQAQPTLVREVARALEQRLGDLVRVQWGDTGRHSRALDVQPHRGAAGIGRGANNFCTAGFVVFRNGVRSSVTAGHCYSNGQSVFSGTAGYGLAAGKAAFPQFDMIRIEASGQNFQRQIWTDPGAPTTRTQTRKIDAGNNMLICTSGAVSRAICNVRVVSQNAMLCQGGQCTSNLARGTKAGVVLSRPGDSGAPMYSADPNVANGAVIHGMAIGTSDGQGDVVWHKMTEVELRLGVTVALN